METSPAPRSETIQGRTARWTTSLVLETWSERSRETNQCFLAPRCGNQQHVVHGLDCIRGSVVKCMLPQVRPFTKKDEAAHGHVMDHMGDLGEQLLHAGDFSYEDITGQDEPPVDLPTPGENTATRHQKPDGEGQMDVDPESRKRMRGKTRLTNLEQPQVLTQPNKTQKNILMTNDADGAR